jgi:hypothetical protein
MTGVSVSFSVGERVGSLLRVSVLLGELVGESVTVGMSVTLWDSEEVALNDGLIDVDRDCSHELE